MFCSNPWICIHLVTLTKHCRAAAAKKSDHEQVLKLGKVTEVTADFTFLIT